MNKVDSVPVGKHPLVTLCILGDRSLNPPQHSVVPCHLSVALVALTEKHYEPLSCLCLADVQIVDVKFFSSSLPLPHALCIDTPFLIDNPFSFVLAMNPAFQL